MKAHIGVDDAAGLVHNVVNTAANVADVAEVTNLLHGEGAARIRRGRLHRCRETGTEAWAEVLDFRRAQRDEGHR